MFFNQGTGPGASRLIVATFSQCKVAFARNAQGGLYEFKVGPEGSGGNGVGCVDVNGDGRTELVGLHYERRGNVVSWTRTVVRLEASRAVNGATDGGTFTSPRDDARIDLLGKATGGNATFISAGRVQEGQAETVTA